MRECWISKEGKQYDECTKLVVSHCYTNVFVSFDVE
jgi:hypothetical protein